MDGDKTEIGWIWKYWFSPEIESDQEITDDLGLIGNPESWQGRLLFVPVITTQDWKQIVQQCSQSSNFLTRFVLKRQKHQNWDTTASDSSKEVTWHKHQLVIGHYWSRDLNARLWLVNTSPGWSPTRPGTQAWRWGPPCQASPGSPARTWTPRTPTP